LHRAPWQPGHNGRACPPAQQRGGARFHRAPRQQERSSAVVCDSTERRGSQGTAGAPCLALHAPFSFQSRLGDFGPLPSGPPAGALIVIGSAPQGGPAPGSWPQPRKLAVSAPVGPRSPKKEPRVDPPRARARGARSRRTGAPAGGVAKYPRTTYEYGNHVHIFVYSYSTVDVIKQRNMVNSGARGTKDKNLRSRCIGKLL
jgi:hypothetical protein